MANIRNLKKDIIFVTSELITSIMIKNGAFGADDDKAATLIVDTLTLRREFISRVNHVDKKSDPKGVKAYFRQLISDFSAKFNELAKQTNEL